MAIVFVLERTIGIMLITILEFTASELRNKYTELLDVHCLVASFFRLRLLENSFAIELRRQKEWSSDDSVGLDPFLR